MLLNLLMRTLAFSFLVLCIIVYIFYYRLLRKNKSFVFEFREAMKFKGVSEPIKTYWLLQNKARPKRPSLQIPPRVPIFTSHSPPSTPSVLPTPLSPKDFSRQISSRLNQISHDSMFIPRTTNNPEIVVDSPGHHEQAMKSGGGKSLSSLCCFPNTTTRVEPIQENHKISNASNSSQESEGRQEIEGRKDSFENGRKDSHDSGILVNPMLQRVPEDEPVYRQRKHGMCVTHKRPQSTSSSVSMMRDHFEKIVDHHKTKQDKQRVHRTSEGPPVTSPVHKKASTVSM